MTQQGNAILKQQKEQIAEKLPDKFDEAFIAIVTDGHKTMFTQQISKLEQKVAALQGPEQVPAFVADGIKKLIAIQFQQAKIPPTFEHPFYAASMAAAQYLACDVLEYIEQKKRIPVDNDLFSATVKAVNQAMMTLYSITPQLFKKTHDAAQQNQSGPNQQAGQDQQAAGKPPMQPPAAQGAA